MPPSAARSAQLTLAVASLLLCVLVPHATPATTPVSTPAPTGAHPPHEDAFNASHNFNCPADCHCVLARHTHQPLLHAKCSSLRGLQSEEPLRATLPVHSIDLSYLNLTRVAHSLEKLHDLTSIDLSHNELHEIGHLGRRIKKLNLKHNRIASAKLGKLPQHVQVLNLQHNDITYLPLEFTKLAQLQSLELSHNQINCSCETLEVRNWLQERHVFMEHPVKCSQPASAAGKSWLQVKQSDICEKEKRGWNAAEEENELLLSDQPMMEASGEHSEEEDDEEELGKAFMPLRMQPHGAGPLTHEPLLLAEEGSGDLRSIHLAPDMLISTDRTLQDDGHTTPVPDGDYDEDDGSGSGAGILYIPQVDSGRAVFDDFEAPDSAESEEARAGDHDEDAAYDSRPIEEPASEETPSPEVFRGGMGIFEGGEGGEPAPTTEQPLEKEPVVPAVHHNLGAASEPEEPVATTEPETTAAGAAGGAEEADAVQHAKVAEGEDNNATYFLLGVICLIIVGLILYVALKRCKQRRRAGHDVENPPQTELLDMDKKNVGKPLQRNGANEHVPLIAEKSKADLAKPINGAGKKPYDAKDAKEAPAQQEPLLKTNGSPTAADGAVPKLSEPEQQAPHQYYPITPRYPTPQSPRASKYAQSPEQNNNNADNVYPSASPTSGRYSPVYSPETGRVKIRLTETPKPKTPMLVTRSKSNAGEIITTPVHGGQLNVPPTAQPPAVAVGPSATGNGHVVDH